MDRRAFLAGAAALFTALLATLRAGQAQQAGKVYRIGYLSSGTSTASAGVTKAFTDGLRDHGWIEGTNITVEYRWGHGEDA